MMKINIPRQALFGSLKQLILLTKDVLLPLWDPKEHSTGKGERFQKWDA